MHSMHLCVIRARTAEEAESRVEDEIADWGDEDNWLTIGGSVSENDELHSTDDGGCCPSAEWMGTMAQINEWFSSLVGEPLRTEVVQQVLRQLADGQDVSDWVAIDRAESYLCQLAEVKCAKNFMTSAPDVLTHEFYRWVFDRDGVTHIGNLDGPQTGKRYVVFVDMHS